MRVQGKAESIEDTDTTFSANLPENFMDLWIYLCVVRPGRRMWTGRIWSLMRQPMDDAQYHDFLSAECLLNLTFLTPQPGALCPSIVQSHESSYNHLLALPVALTSPRCCMTPVSGKPSIGLRERTSHTATISSWNTTANLEPEDEKAVRNISFERVRLREVRRTKLLIEPDKTPSHCHSLRGPCDGESEELRGEVCPSGENG